METKKSPKADLERKKPVFRKIGMIISLALVLLAFQWRSYDKIITDPLLTSHRSYENDWTDVSVALPQEKLPPPPAYTNIHGVENDIDLETDFYIDAGIDPNTAAPVYEKFSLPEEKSTDDDTPRLSAEIMPEFPGGEQALFKFLGTNIIYPRIAKEAGIQGIVYIGFIVEKDGSISHIELKRGIGGGCDEEALRVTGIMPNWSPGRQNGMPVRVKFSLPIRFTLH